MSETEFAWPPALTPHITVSDGRRALDRYVDLFRAHFQLWQPAD